MMLPRNKHASKGIELDSYMEFVPQEQEEGKYIVLHGQSSPKGFFIRELFVTDNKWSCCYCLPNIIKELGRSIPACFGGL